MKQPHPQLSGRRIDTLWVVAGISLILIGLIIGAHLIPMGSTVTGELALNEWFAAHRTGIGNTLALIVHYGLGPILAPIMILALAVAAILLRQRRLAAVVVIVPIVGWGCAKIAKTLWNRPRPPAHQLRALVLETSASFPSGHTAFAAAAVATLITALAIYRIHIAWWVYLLCFIFTAAVGLSRMYVGAHYLADVLSAPLYCWGAVALIAPLLRRLRIAPRTP